MQIRKLFFIAIFFFTLTFQVKAQISVGIIGGLTMQSLSGDAPVNASYSKGTGYMIGLSVEHRIGNGINLMLQPNVARTQTVIGIDIGEEEPKDSFDVKLNFIRIPLVVKVEAFNGVTYFISGVDLGILQSAKIRDVNKTKEEKDIKDDFNEIDFAALFGAGVKFKLAKKINLLFEGRYSQSLTNLSKDNQGAAFSNLPSRFRQSGFQILTSVLYNF